MGAKYEVGVAYLHQRTDSPFAVSVLLLDRPYSHQSADCCMFLSLPCFLVTPSSLQRKMLTMRSEKPICAPSPPPPPHPPNTLSHSAHAKRSTETDTGPFSLPVPAINLSNTEFTEWYFRLYLPYHLSLRLLTVSFAYTDREATRVDSEYHFISSLVRRVWCSHCNTDRATTVNIVMDSVKKSVRWIWPLQSRVSVIIHSVSQWFQNKVQLSLTLRCIS